MKLDELKAIIEDDINRTKDYADHLRKEIQPMLTVLGQEQIQHLHFFNLGYRNALERVLDIMKQVKESHD